MTYVPVTYETLSVGELCTIKRGSDNRYYVFDNDKPTMWRYSSPDYDSAVKSADFSVSFWREKMVPEMKDSANTARINHVHYRIGDENADRRGFRGFGGAKFYIKFNDGRLVESTNMWCQGDIPSLYWDELPDNAVFLDEVQWKLAQTAQAVLTVLDNNVYPPLEELEVLGNNGDPLPRPMNEDDHRMER